MSPKFFYLYLIAGIVALILVIIQIATEYPAVNYRNAIIYFIPVLLLFYMANKVYQVKNDSELM